MPILERLNKKYNNATAFGTKKNDFEVKFSSAIYFQVKVEESQEQYVERYRKVSSAIFIRESTPFKLLNTINLAEDVSLERKIDYYLFCIYTKNYELYLKRKKQYFAYSPDYKFPMVDSFDELGEFFQNYYSCYKEYIEPLLLAVLSLNHEIVFELKSEHFKEFHELFEDFKTVNTLISSEVKRVEAVQASGLLIRPFKRYKLGLKQKQYPLLFQFMTEYGESLSAQGAMWSFSELLVVHAFANIHPQPKEATFFDGLVAAFDRLSEDEKEKLEKFKQLFLETVEAGRKGLTKQSGRGTPSLLDDSLLCFNECLSGLALLEFEHFQRIHCATEILAFNDRLVTGIEESRVDAVKALAEHQERVSTSLKEMNEAFCAVESRRQYYLIDSAYLPLIKIFYEDYISRKKEAILKELVKSTFDEAFLLKSAIISALGLTLNQDDIIVPIVPPLGFGGDIILYLPQVYKDHLPKLPQETDFNFIADALAQLGENAKLTTTACMLKTTIVHDRNFSVKVTFPRPKEDTMKEFCERLEATRSKYDRSADGVSKQKRAFTSYQLRPGYSERMWREKKWREEKELKSQFLTKPTVSLS